ncbi:MAG: glycosyltransferase family 2 protein [Eubacterium sp.]|nr:glycosyltransferase family 2 protein [Eubacterium sp.]
MADDPLAGKDARRLFDEKFTKERFCETLHKTLAPVLLTCGLGRDGRITAESEGQPQGLHAADADRIPAISVAMAACNGEEYLPEQLDSLLPQLGENDEVVVSVDPSQDRTFEILFEYAAKDPRIRVLEGPGKGVIRNVENALQNCSGQTIYLCDQDDVWMPDKVEKISKALAHHTLVLHDAQIVDAELNETAPSFMSWRRSRKGVLANIRKNSYIGCCMAFRRELLTHVLPFPENLPMHDQWIGLMAEKHGSVRLLHVPLIQYRRHDSNATKQTHASPAQMLKWRAEITREVLRR